MNQERTATMRTRLELEARRPSVRGGFTLTELLVVITITGIILAFLLSAGMDGIRRAEERATQALIIKLETAVNDRIEALMIENVDPVVGHYMLAWIYNGALPAPDPTNPPAFEQNSAPFSQRAQTIARIDFLKREMPDVFLIDPSFFSNPNSYSGPYALNFAGNRYPTTLGGVWDFVLPIGDGARYNPALPTPGWYNTPGDGIYGASYTAAAGIYKNLGYLRNGYDGVDNDGNGQIDEWGEGVDTSNRDLVVGRLSAHQHKTARSEMLYALLVEGRGPLGSYFSPDDFTDKEVRDTDGDGLPEFVDAWGEPIQFYRWPLMYHSLIQRGQGYDPLFSAFRTPYADMIDEREQGTLDLNQQLMAPAWWADKDVNANFVNDAYNYSSVYFPAGFQANATLNFSPCVTAFEKFFHILHEPMTLSGTDYQTGYCWDRGAPGGGTPHRRAYYSKPLIVSWGPDKLPGVFGYYPELNQSGPASVDDLLLNENNACQFDPTQQPVDVNKTTPNALTLELQVQGQDDISNHSLQAGDAGS